MPAMRRTPLLALLLAACTAEPAADRTLAATVTHNIAAHIAVRYPPSACDVSGGRPIILTHGRPVVGEPIQVQFLSQPIGPVAAPAALIVSRNRATFHPIATAPGCMLGVHVDRVILPAPGTFLTQEGGTLYLDLTFPAAMLGDEWYAQAVFLTPTIVFSPVLEILVGSR